MKLAVVTLLACASLAYGRSFGIDYDLEQNTAYGYLEKYGIPIANEIRQIEEEQLAQSRIVGGSSASVGQFPYQAGLVVNLPGGSGVCGASLLTRNRALTAAHCWWDGRNQARSFTVVLGSNRLFSGGVRMESRNIIMHGSWNPSAIRNDVAMIRLPNNVNLNNHINTIPLPSGGQLNENFVGTTAVASGFGRTRDNAGSDGTLNHVNLPVISNAECARTFGSSIQSSNLCTSGANGRSTCQGDSGGPLAATRSNRRILIGVTSFGHISGCQRGHPAAFARVTSFMDWIRRNL